MKRRALLLVPFAAGAAQAHSLKFGDLRIGHVWGLPAPIGEGQVFMPLLNVGSAEEGLVAARGDICSVIELRRNARYDDPAEKQFALASNKPFPMRPSAAHLRLIGLRRPMVLGDRFPLILDFLTAGEIEVEVFVENTPGT